MSENISQLLKEDVALFLSIEKICSSNMVLNKMFEDQINRYNDFRNKVIEDYKKEKNDLLEKIVKVEKNLSVDLYDLDQSKFEYIESFVKEFSYE